MGPARSFLQLQVRLQFAAYTVILVCATACGAGAAAPTPTTAAVPTAPAAPPPSPQRPQLASPVASPSPASSSASASSTATPEVAGQTYEVESGDTLATIATQFYDDASQWRRIYDANKDSIGADPDKLKIGMKLTIPPKP